MDESARNAAGSSVRSPSIARAIVFICGRRGSTKKCARSRTWTSQRCFAEIEIPEHFLYEHRELIVGISFALANCARVGSSLGSTLDGSVGNRSLTDSDLIAALSSQVRSYRTLVESSLIYEQATANPVQQTIAREVATMVNEFREEEAKHLGYSRLKDSDVLKVLVFWLRMGMTRTSGRPKSRAFVDSLFAQFPQKASGIAAPEDVGSRLIVP